MRYKPDGGGVGGGVVVAVHPSILWIDCYKTSCFMSSLIIYVLLIIVKNKSIEKLI